MTVVTASPTDLPSLNHLRNMTSPPNAREFHVGILIGPGFIPMDMVGIQTVFGLMPGAKIHLLWKSLELVEGFPSWWTRPTTVFADCPVLDVLAVPMLPPEIQNDAEVVEFVAFQAARARYLIGICNGVLLLGAAGLLKGKRVTASHNALPILAELGAAETVAGGSGVVVDGRLFTAGPGVGSFEAALLVVERAFGRAAGELAEFIIEYDPHPPFQTGVAHESRKEQVAQVEGMMAGIAAQYRDGSIAALAERETARHGPPSTVVESLTVNNIRLQVRRGGEGSPTLVFIHYWGGTSRTWAAVMDRLSRSHISIAPDLRGWGGSDKHCGEYGIEAQAEDVIALIVAMKLERYVLVGHSMGGKIAQMVAAQSPPGLAGLVLIAPAPPTPLPVPEAQRQNMLASYQSREGILQALDVLTANPLTIMQREQVIDDTLGGAPDAKRAWVDEGMLLDISARVSEILIPVLVVVGDADRVETAASLRQELGTRIAKARFEILPGVGHLSPLEAPDSVARAIVAFTRQIDPS